MSTVTGNLELLVHPSLLEWIQVAVPRSKSSRPGAHIIWGRKWPLISSLNVQWQVPVACVVRGAKASGGDSECGHPQWPLLQAEAVDRRAERVLTVGRLAVSTGGCAGIWHWRCSEASQMEETKMLHWTGLPGIQVQRCQPFSGGLWPL
jgi:hypothetical protein